MKRYSAIRFDEIPAVKCPCGQSRRGFATPDNDLATVHVVDISVDAQTHYHRKMTEIYVVLEGEGSLEVDGDIVLLTPMTSVMIQPGCKHRAVGKLKILNIAIPAFDPADEYFD